MSECLFVVPAGSRRAFLHTADGIWSKCRQSRACYVTIGNVAEIPEALARHLSLATPQRKFQFNSGQWNRWLGSYEGVSALIDNLPQDGLDRADVAVIVERELPGNPAGAFVASMIWGHGRSNYGAFRTARVLTANRSGRASAGVSSEVIAKLAESVDVVRDEGAVEGFRFMNSAAGKVRWLGPAFFTKWLYFASARGSLDTPDAAPILDALVIRWLRRNAEVSLRQSWTSDYESYVALLAEWGREALMTPSQVEQQIFQVIRKDGVGERS